jgi:hypothetical protein
VLVYANWLQIDGGDAFDVVARTIHGWLTDQLGQKIPRGEFFSSGQWGGDGGRKSAWLRSYAALGEEPEMHAWRLRHADDDVSGRQWLVEIGLKRESSGVEFSCVIQTEELSVLITKPVAASRPRLIRYLIGNLKDGVDARFSIDTPGVILKEVGADRDSYRGLLAEIDRKERDYPVVLVSPDQDGEYLINPFHLQEALLGLAQVVQVVKGFSSWDMEEVLGRHFSAWGGAVNLIRVPSRHGFSQASLALSEEVIGWGGNQTDRVAAVLARVTHNTNVPRQRKRIRPDGVAMLAIFRRMEKQRHDLRNMTGSEQGMVELLEQGLNELTELNRKVQDELDAKKLECMQLEEDKDILSNDLRAERFRISHAFRQSQDNVGFRAELNWFVDLASRPGEPSPVECLEAVAQAFSSRIVVLDSAYESARDHAIFESGRRLLRLLKTLASEFVDAMIEGGDDVARRCFTNSEYAATESEGTQKNKEMKQKRTFIYNGHATEMWRHLKIGVADDQRLSIRVYFEWISSDRKIVIGHCGAHLPVISH